MRFCAVISPAFLPSMKARMPSNTWVMMVEPPGEPITARRSLPTTMLGVIDDSIRLPPTGALAEPPIRPNALGWPDTRAKSSISLLSRMPVLPATKLEPRVVFTVAVIDTMLPSLSTIE